MNLDNELESLEESGQTEAEAISEDANVQGIEDDIDDILGPDAEESDLEHAYDSFMTGNEVNYDGYDPIEVEEEEAAVEVSNMLNSEGYHVEDRHDLEEEVIEMEIDEGDIYAYLVDEDDNEIGFILIDEDGNEQQYLYVDMDEYEIVDEEGDHGTRVERVSDGEEFDLGLTREEISETTDGLNDIYKEGVEVVGELKDAVADITDGLKIFKKKK